MQHLQTLDAAQKHFRVLTQDAFVGGERRVCFLEKCLQAL
jgi:hypothetical protein